MKVSINRANHCLGHIGRIENKTQIEKVDKLNTIENWTKLKIGQNWKLDKIENWTKIENSTELKIVSNWKLYQIEN